MRHLVNILRVVRLSLLDALQYRVDTFIFVLSGAVRPLIMLAIWIATMASGAKVPMSQNEFVQYYLLVMFVGSVTSSWSAPFISMSIRRGKLSPFLLKPLSYFQWDIGQNMGEKILKLIYLIPIMGIVLYLFKTGFPVVNFNIAVLSFASLIMAFLSNYIMRFCVGLLAFWLDDSGPVDDLIDLFKMILSGSLVPIATMPIILQNLSLALPFRYMLSLPIEIYLGKLNEWQIVQGLAIQFFWLVIFVLLYRVLWNGGIKKYSAVGA